MTAQGGQHLAGGTAVAQHVVANARDKNYVAARARRRDRLIRPFAAGRGRKRAADYRLAGRGNAVPFNNHIGVRTSNDDNLRF